MQGDLDMRLLSLRPREISVLRGAWFAWTQVENGNFLPPTGNAPSTRRLISYGFLDKSTNQGWPPFPDWIVVVLTRENYQTMLAIAASKGGSLTEELRAFDPVFPLMWKGAAS